MSTQNKSEDMTPSMKLMEAMNGIRKEYIEAAGEARTAASGSGKAGKARILRPSFYARIAAAAVAISIILPNTGAGVAYAMQRIPVVGAYFQLVTFRNYSYEDANHSAEVAASGITVDESGTASAGSGVQEAAEASAADINSEIQETVDSLIADFKSTLGEEGYSTLDVRTETVTDNDRWYVIRLSSFQAQADGYEENRYYVISRQTGKRVALADLFRDGSDYRKVISDEIIRQMREKEQEDPNNMYFLDEEDSEYIPDAQFTGISDDQQFYINNKDELVIAFQEGEAAPMYMGAQEFVIPDDVTADILAAEL